MSEYIDKSKLIEALSIFNDKENGNPHFLNGIKTAIEIAENYAVDGEVEKVVHCGVCRHLQLSACSNIARCTYLGRNIYCDGYCNFGERNMAIK